MTGSGLRLPVFWPRRQHVLSLFLIFLLPLLAGAAGERPAEDIMRSASRYYYGKGVAQDYSQALMLYMQAAEAGDAEAQYIAGGMYLKGMGTPVDYRKAFELLYRAAQNGKSTVQSQKVLAQAFLQGRGVPKDYAEAFRWYTIAADNGDPEAQNELAFMYFTGNGVDPDYEKAYEYFLQAAKQGLVLAQYNLGIMHYSGNGVAEVDLVGAYSWFSLAAAKGHPQSLQARQFLESIMSSDELTRAQSQARNLFLETGRP